MSDQNATYQLTRIADSLHRIAQVAEGREMQARQRLADLEPNSIGAAALWREEVARGDTLLGFADWLAWHTAGKDSPEPG